MLGTTGGKIIPHQKQPSQLPGDGCTMIQTCVMPRCQSSAAKDGKPIIHRDWMLLAGPKSMSQFTMVWRCLELWVKGGYSKQRKEMILRRHSPHILTLPTTISKLKSVLKLKIQCSDLHRIPVEIAGMEHLEELDLRMNTQLHWLPYEIVHLCHLREIKACQQDLYGNLEYTTSFPELPQMRQDIRPDCCIVCHRTFSSLGCLQRWTTQTVGGIDVPLLLHACSSDCINAVPDAPQGYVPRPHLGGISIVQPDVQWHDGPMPKHPIVWVDNAELVSGEDGQVDNRPTGAGKLPLASVVGIPMKTAIRGDKVLDHVHGDQKSNVDQSMDHMDVDDEYGGNDPNYTDWECVSSRLMCDETVSDTKQSERRRSSQENDSGWTIVSEVSR